MIKRRHVIKAMGASALMLPFLSPVSFARTATGGKFILIILRGAMDGLGAVPAYGDPTYRKQRGKLAFDAGQILKLDGLFGLNPALKNLHQIYQSGEANIIHAIASPYRSRSHFDGQDVLENGTETPLTDQTGWLGRLLAENRSGDDHNAIALSQGIPLILRGSAKSTSWAPSRLPGLDDDLLQRLRYLYQQDDMLKNSLDQAVKANDIAETSMGNSQKPRQKLRYAAEHAVKFLNAPNGPNIAILENYGWDTHARQGTVKGPLANNLRELDAALGIIKAQSGPSWDNTAVACVTEFGRTVWANGNDGTDHGTASVAFLLGGAVRGGRVIADWPGLGTAELYQERDLYPTTDMRALFKAIIRDHLHISPAIIEGRIFKNSRAITPLDGLFKT